MSGLTSEQKNIADSRHFQRQPHSEDDIFCLLKLNLADMDLCQEPMFVFPANAERDVRDALANADSHAGFRNSIERERAEGLLTLAQALRAYPQYERGARYMEQVAGQRRRVLHGLHPLQFLAGARFGRRVAVPGGELPERPPVGNPYRLQAVFHRVHR